MARKSRSPEDILLAEFDYIADTANRADEDRAQVSSFYLIAVGSLVAALFSTQLLSPAFALRSIQLVFSLLFLGLTVLGTTTVLQLARLRATWYEAMLAMNQIKEHAIRKDKSLAGAFRWRANTLPPIYKLNSISYLKTLEAAMLSGLTFAASAYFFQVAVGYTRCLWAFTPALGLFAFLGELLLYKRSLQ